MGTLRLSLSRWAGSGKSSVGDTIRPVVGKSKKVSRNPPLPVTVWLVPYGDSGDILVIDAETHCAVRIERPVMIELPSDEIVSLDPLHG